MFGKITKSFIINSAKLDSQHISGRHYYKILPVKNALKYIRYQIHKVSPKLRFEIKEITDTHACIEIKGPEKLINVAAYNILTSYDKFLKYYEWSEIQ